MIRTESVRRSTLTTTFSYLLGKPLNLAVSVLVAYRFGTGAQLEAFFWAMVLLAQLHGYVLGNWGLAAVPVLVGLDTSEPSAVPRFVGFITFWSTLLALGSAGLLYFLAPFAVERLTRFDGPTAALATDLLPLLLPYYLFFSFHSVQVSLLQAFAVFTVPALLENVLRSLILIALLLAFSDHGILALVLANDVAQGVLWVLVAGMLIRRGVLVARWYLTLPRSQFAAFWHLLWPFYVTQLVDSATELLARFLLTGRTHGGLAFVGWAERVVQWVSGPLHGGVAKVMLTDFSALAAKHGKKAAVDRCVEAVSLTWFFVVPLSAYLFFFGDLVLALLFRRGAFDQHSVEQSYLALRWLSLGLIATSAHYFTTRVYYALGDSIIGLYTCLPALGVAIGLNLWLEATLGFEGVALAQTLLTSYSVVLLGCILHLRHAPLPYRHLGSRLLLFGSLAFPLVGLARLLLDDVLPRPQVQPTLVLLALVALTFMLFAGLYCGVCRWLRLPECTLFAQSLDRFWKRKYPGRQGGSDAPPTLPRGAP
ncbi:MAG: hypothetical protein A2284_04185 [Deltaproteobacteria bacterium RIFOXYA12_FULL_61_11]|nr:MAG: hypothetical protein A2284_04185 [Deltaproteobacteria bacterium RIFOXYA12_FULL_61_11]